MLLVALPLGWPTPARGERAEVLVIRPEKLPPPQYPPLPLPQRDPFNWSREQVNRFKDQEPVVKSNSVAGLTLTGIIWDKNRPLAMINDRVVAVGDQVQGATILEIGRGLVVFTRDGLYHTLWLETPVLGLQPAKERRKP